MDPLSDLLNYHSDRAIQIQVQLGWVLYAETGVVQGVPQSSRLLRAVGNVHCGPGLKAGADAAMDGMFSNPSS